MEEESRHLPTGIPNDRDIAGFYSAPGGCSQVPRWIAWDRNRMDERFRHMSSRKRTECLKLWSALIAGWSKMGAAGEVQESSRIGTSPCFVRRMGANRSSKAALTHTSAALCAGAKDSSLAISTDAMPVIELTRRATSLKDLTTLSPFSENAKLHVVQPTRLPSKA